MSPNVNIWHVYLKKMRAAVTSRVVMAVDSKPYVCESKTHSMHGSVLTCEIISNSFECNHGNRIIAYILRKVILCKVARKMLFMYVPVFLLV